MKYSININQVGITEAGLWDQTDLIDWAIIDYLKSWYFAERKKTIWVEEKRNHYVLLNYNCLMENMPAIKIKTKRALSDRIKKLKKLELIDTIQLKNNSLYFIITDKCINIIDFQKSNKDYGSESKYPVEARVNRVYKHGSIPYGSESEHNKYISKNINKNINNIPADNNSNILEKIKDKPIIDDLLKMDEKQLAKLYREYNGADPDPIVILILYIAGSRKYLHTDPPWDVLERLVFNTPYSVIWVRDAIIEMGNRIKRGGLVKNFNYGTILKIIKGWENQGLSEDESPLEHFEKIQSDINRERDRERENEKQNSNIVHMDIPVT